MAKTKRLAFMALLTAMALTIFVIEAQIPAPVPIPGVKLGLSNIITLTAMLLLGKKEAGIVLLLRIIMGAMFTGSPAALIYSISGGVLAYIVMCLLVGRFPEKLIWVVSGGRRRAQRGAAYGLRAHRQNPRAALLRSGARRLRYHHRRIHRRRGDVSCPRGAENYQKIKIIVCH